MEGSGHQLSVQDEEVNGYEGAINRKCQCLSFYPLF
jgi:hypothetical protein